MENRRDIIVAPYVPTNFHNFFRFFIFFNQTLLIILYLAKVSHSHRLQAVQTRTILKNDALFYKLNYSFWSNQICVYWQSKKKSRSIDFHTYLRNLALSSRLDRSYNFIINHMRYSILIATHSGFLEH